MAKYAHDVAALVESAAAVILCGGESRRMGQPKWALPFGNETTLDRVARILGEVSNVIVVVAAAGGELPTLSVRRPGRTILARDRQAGRGPLEGLAVGLARAAEEGAQRAFVTACDAPLLQPAFVRKMLELSVGFEAAVPQAGDRLHPLTAVYSTHLSAALDLMLVESARKVQALAERVQTRWVASEELLEADPRLLSLRNVNTPEDYAAALTEAGFPRPSAAASPWVSPEQQRE